MKKILILGIRGYQKYLSPLKTVHCPYTPTCSQYALEAIQKHGAAKEACWQHGEYCGAIRCHTADMILCRKFTNLYSGRNYQWNYY